MRKDLQRKSNWNGSLKGGGSVGKYVEGGEHLSARVTKSREVSVPASFGWSQRLRPVA